MSHAPQQTVFVQTAGTSGLAIAGLIFAILGWFTCGLLCIPGALLCLLGLFTKGPKGAAIAGLIVGFPGTIFFAFIGLGIIMSFLGLGAATVGVATNDREQPADVQRLPRVAPTHQGDDPADTEVKQSEPNEPPEPLSPLAGWSSEPVTLDSVRVELREFALGGVLIEKFGSTSDSRRDDILRLRVSIKNLSDVKKLDYSGWGMRNGYGGDGVELVDEFGNDYSLIHFGIGGDVVGTLPSGKSIYPDEAVADLLLFQTPVPKARTFTLTLPGRPVDVDGDFKLTITLPTPDPETTVDDEPSTPDEVLAPEDELVIDEPTPDVEPEIELPDPIVRTPALSEKEFRDWTSADGSKTMRARIINKKSGWIQLELEDGSKVAVELSKLSDADRNYAAEFTPLD